MHGRGWPDTLLIWTYDEHGGYYDHVTPPPACLPMTCRAQPHRPQVLAARVLGVIFPGYVRHSKELVSDPLSTTPMVSASPL